jgi:hypothetical protein
MSVSGISSASLYDPQSVQNNFQQFQQTFQQLGKDLQSGNLSAAQSDFATLQQLQPQSGATSSSASESNNPIAQTFSQLSTDLQSGNLSAAQQDYTTIQQALQTKSTQSEATAGHHHHHSDGSEIGQLLDQLSTELQSGDLSTAQGTFSTLQQDLQDSSQNSGQTSSGPGSNSVSVTA